MRTKAAFIIGGAVGYVLGTRAGREQFEKIRESAQKAWENPKVQESISDVEQRATDLMRDKAPELKEKLGGAVRTAQDSVRGKSDDGEPGTTYSSDPTSSTSSGTTNGSTSKP